MQFDFFSPRNVSLRSIFWLTPHTSSKLRPLGKQKKVGRECAVGPVTGHDSNGSQVNFPLERDRFH